MVTLTPPHYINILKVDLPPLCYWLQIISLEGYTSGITVATALMIVQFYGADEGPSSYTTTRHRDPVAGRY